MKNRVFIEYNLNVINLNYILKENIELDISNYLYDNNIKLTSSLRDTNRILLHFILESLLKYTIPELHNVFVVKKPFNLKYLYNDLEYPKLEKLLSSVLERINKKFNITIFFLSDKQTIDKNLIHEIRSLKKSNANKSLKSIKIFLETHKLTKISKNVETNLGTKFKLLK